VKTSVDEMIELFVSSVPARDDKKGGRGPKQ